MCSNPHGKGFQLITFKRGKNVFWICPKEELSVEMVVSNGVVQ
jgi:hypothetical protein